MFVLFVLSEDSSMKVNNGSLHDTQAWEERGWYQVRDMLNKPKMIEIIANRCFPVIYALNNINQQKLCFRQSFCMELQMPPPYNDK